MEAKTRLGFAAISLVLACLASMSSAVAGGSGTWTLTRSMITGRYDHTATVLKSGHVLVAGGENDAVGGALASAELYNPATGIWSPTGSMHMVRWGHTATRLRSGDVLVVGGWTGAPGGIVQEAELYSPTTGSWTVIAPPLMPHISHTAVLMPNGEVLVVGGCTDADCFEPFDYAEIYDPKTQTWTAAARTRKPHIYHTETVLMNGNVLVAGGSPYPGNFAESYDPATNTWTATRPMRVGRTYHTATLLPNGQVLVAGGNSAVNHNEPTATAEVFDPTALTWSLTGSLATPRYAGSAALLDGSGQALVAGGLNYTDYVWTAELYDPGTGKFAPTGALLVGRNDQTMNVLSNGLVFMAGGFNSLAPAGALGESELYIP
jgi:hypothetical protein